jgi:hypothetical protein
VLEVELVPVERQTPWQTAAQTAAPAEGGPASGRTSSGLWRCGLLVGILIVIAVASWLLQARWERRQSH